MLFRAILWLQLFAVRSRTSVLQVNYKYLGANLRSVRAPPYLHPHFFLILKHSVRDFQLHQTKTVFLELCTYFSSRVSIPADPLAVAQLTIYSGCVSGGGGGAKP